MTSTCTSSTTQRLPAWRRDSGGWWLNRRGNGFSGGARSPEKDRGDHDCDHNHEERCELRLAQSEEQGRVGTQEAEKESPGRVKAAVYEAEHPVGQPPLQSLVER